ncbi:uncharacterized protein LOC107793938 [Nicotiana tabacum]|uniref:Uncharacterized protein LOC107793938 n=2 Tax=Nicotiana TaxID=4085 RepID=A0A1S4A5E0_TOBAC|nr:PREDICTED: uncharacterized protein LOC104228292 [Nicotiana sylvestris]XP_016471872.1 PREDICTED: uncharacterized protein LOC107793938 [Nicotiana tabacum]
MRNIKARFLKPIRSDPRQRDLCLWCEYRGTHCHRTGDSRHLHEEVTTLLKNGHLREFLSNRAKNNQSRDNAERSKVVEGCHMLTINTIFRENEVYVVTFLASKKMKISVTYNKRLWEVVEDDITFTEEDTVRLLPHNDALIISLSVLDFKIKSVLADPGSSANIIQLRVLEQAKLIGNIIPMTKLLDGFSLTSVTTREEILLPTNAERLIKTTLFEVVDGDMGYDIILGRLWMHLMKVVLSTYHQLLSLPNVGRS